MRIIALLLVTIFSFKNSALAEDENPMGISLYGSFLHTERVPNALFFFDKIKDGDSFELRKALRDHDIEIVVLSSPGGSVYEGLTMAGILHDKKLTTYIPKKNLFTDGQGDCASACAYMYFAGSTRVADGKLGVHQFASKNADDKASIAEIQESAQTVVSDIAGLLGDFEVPAFVYPKMFQSREMYYFKESELAEIERVEKEIGYNTVKKIDSFTNDLIFTLAKINQETALNTTTPNVEKFNHSRQDQQPEVPISPSEPKVNNNPPAYFDVPTKSNELNIVPIGKCEIVIASRKTLVEARQLYDNNDLVGFGKIFQSSNGWYAITVGAIETSEATKVLDNLKRLGKIPDDAYCSIGKRFISQIY